MKNVFAFILLFLFSSCTFISTVTPKKRTIKNYDELTREKNIKVEFLKKHESHMWGKEIGSKGKFRSDNFSSTVFKLSKEGHIDKYVLCPRKKVPIVYLDYFIGSALIGYSSYLVLQEFEMIRLGGALAGGMIITQGALMHNINQKKITLPTNLTAHVPHSPDLKYMSFNEIIVDANKVSTTEYNSLKKYNKQKIKRLKTKEISLKQNYPTSKINRVLFKNGYYDTLSLMTSSLNTLTIDATIFDHNTVRFKTRDLYDIVQYNFGIKFEFRETFTDSVIYTYQDTVASDFHYERTESKKILIDQCIMKSFFELMKSPNISKALHKQEVEENYEETITLFVDSAASFYGEAISACVTVKVNNGHGSGFFISNDGYIITNLHVVGSSKEVEVILNNDDILKANLIRRSVKHDLALLKVDMKPEVSLRLNENEYSETTDIGKSIIVIGTPNNIQLGQSVSRGIISGFRDYKNIKYYQTDAAINSGNSGGPMVNEKGTVLGVVNAKLIGAGVERIGFAIPTAYVFEQLNISY